MDLEPRTLMALCGFGLGTVAGLAARGADFCTYRAIEDWWVTGDKRRLRTWGLAIAVAIILVQTMFATGMARIDESFISHHRWAGAAPSSVA